VARSYQAASQVAGQRQTSHPPGLRSGINYAE
jgi:hypothetical protein